MTLRTAWLPILSLWLWVACTHHIPTHQTITYPPPRFEYFPSTAEAEVGSSFPSLVPFPIPNLPIFGPTSPPTGYQITPGLPDGLTLDAKSGVISGQPLAPIPWTDFSVRSSNTAGAMTTQLRIRIYAPGDPFGLAYATTWHTGWRDVPLNIPAPVVLGPGPFTFSISPSLPPGLTFDTASGSCSGTPSESGGFTTYVVKAANAQGSTTTSFTLKIDEGQIPYLIYPTSTFAAEVGKPLTPMRPREISRPLATEFNVAPPLPRGLVLDAATGTLSGTPEEATAMATYEVSAQNALGTSRTPLVISTVPQGWPSIQSFTASLIRGNGLDPAYYEIAWAVQNTSETSINGQRVLASPLFLPYPSPTQTFTLTATNAQGSSTAQLTLPLLP